MNCPSCGSIHIVQSLTVKDDIIVVWVKCYSCHRYIGKELVGYKALREEVFKDFETL